MLLFFLPARAAFFAAAIKLVDGGPSPGFGVLGAKALFLIARFDVSGLTFLFLGITGFIALRHG